VVLGGVLPILVAGPTLAQSVRQNRDDMGKVMDQMIKEFMDAPKDSALDFAPVPEGDKPQAKAIRPGSEGARRDLINAIQSLETVAR
jgi:hypothetical protein